MTEDNEEKSYFDFVKYNQPKPILNDKTKPEKKTLNISPRKISDSEDVEKILTEHFPPYCWKG